MLALAMPLGLGLGCVIALGANYSTSASRRSTRQMRFRGSRNRRMPQVAPRELARLAKRGRADLGRYDPASTRLLPLTLQPPLLHYAEAPTSMFAEAVRSFAWRFNARSEPDRPDGCGHVGPRRRGQNHAGGEFAFSLAVIGVRTVLVEGDLRNPEMTRSLCPHARFGLLDVAMNESRFTMRFWSNKSRSSRSCHRRPRRSTVAITEFAFSEGISAIFEALRPHYDVIVIDAPPLIPLADTHAFAEHADCILLAVAWDRTPFDVLARASELLAPVYDRISARC